MGKIIIDDVEEPIDTEGRIFVNGQRVVKMFCNGQAIKSAYVNGQKVFSNIPDTRTGISTGSFNATFTVSGVQFSAGSGLILGVPFSGVLHSITIPDVNPNSISFFLYVKKWTLDRTSNTITETSTIQVWQDTAPPLPVFTRNDSVWDLQCWLFRWRNIAQGQPWQLVSQSDYRSNSQFCGYL